MIVVALILLAYLVGSFPSALIVGRLARGIDIREHGSGNMGATNVFRVLGMRWGLVVAVLDLAKGFLPVFFFVRWGAAGSTIDPLYQQIMYGFAAVLGHVLTVFGGFHGGKGVLTGLGVFLALMPLEAGSAFGVFVIAFGLSRIVSLGSLIAAAALCVIVLIEKYFLARPLRQELVLTCLLLFVLVLVTHRSNVRRLVAGTEPRFRKSRG